MGDTLTRTMTTAAVLLVAAIAAVVSFIHIEALAVNHGQTELAAVLLPLSIDGTVAAMSLVMLRCARSSLPTPWLARGMLALAVLATLAANVTSGLPDGAVNAIISAWPAVGFVGCVEVTIWMARKTRPATAKATPARHEPATATRQKATTQATRARKAGVSVRTLQRRAKAMADAAPLVADETMVPTNGKAH